MEKETRRARYGEYLAYREASLENRAVSLYLKDRDTIWDEVRVQKEKEIRDCTARIEKLTADLATNEAGRARGHAEMGPRAAKWKEERAGTKMWEAYFALEGDEVPS